jgi:co-chaperonin GroES (HSP10)
MSNQSGLVPLGRAVLVRMIELDELRADSIIIPEQIRQSSAVMETRCEVVAIGASCWTDEPEPRCAVGDKVIVTRLAGYVAVGPRDKGVYRLVNDRDIFCRVEEN